MKINFIFDKILSMRKENDREPKKLLIRSLSCRESLFLLFYFAPAFFCFENCAALFPGSPAADADAEAGRRKAAVRAAVLPA